VLAAEPHRDSVQADDEHAARREQEDHAAQRPTFFPTLTAAGSTYSASSNDTDRTGVGGTLINVPTPDSRHNESRSRSNVSTSSQTRLNRPVLGSND
jgi:hypothetical protein